MSARSKIRILLLLALGAGAGAAPDPMAALIANLHSMKYAVRESATLDLMRLSPEHRSDIEDALAHETDPEAAARLERVAVHLFMKARTSLTGDSGVLGISLQVEAVQLDPKRPVVQAAIVVMKTQPGFPSAEELEPCDQILGMNGEEFTMQTNADDFRKKIVETPPGESVRLRVLREGKILELPVRVAGLRNDDAPLLLAIVQQRDAAIAAYEAGLKSGLAERPLVIAEEGGEGAMVAPAEDGVLDK